MGNNYGAGRDRRNDLYARTMQRADQLAASRRRRQRLLVTLPAAVVVLGLTGGVLTAVVSTGAASKAGHIQATGNSTTTTVGPTTTTGPVPSTTTTPSTNPPAISYVGFAPQSFTAVSLDHWWVLGSNCDASTSTCPVLETTDGGQSFEKSSAPEESLSSRVSPGIRFANASDGFVFGPKLFTTTNDGKSWVAEDLQGEVTDVEAADGQAFALSCTGTTCSLYSEQVGTNNWSKVSLPSTLSAHASLYVSGSRVVITEGVSASPTPVNFLISTDGGTTFVSRQSPCFPGLGGVVVPAINQSDALWAACPTGMQATAFVSSDNGQTWSGADGQQISPTGSVAPCGQAASGSCAPEFSNGLALAPVTASTALAWPAVYGAGMALTTDGGTSYDKVYSGLQSDIVSWAGYSDPTRAYAILQGSSGSGSSLIESTDGGQSWQEVAFKS